MDPRYQAHPVREKLSRHAAFYETLSTAVFGFVSMGTRAICNIDSYVYSSIQGTLGTTSDALLKGRIGDAFSLLRRYHDSAVINVYSSLYLQDHFGPKNFTVQHIQAWLSGKERLPEFRVMSKYIRDSEKLRPITKLLFAGSTYTDIRDRCNDFTHYNFYASVLSNDGDIYLKNRLALLDTFAKDLDNLLILHLSLIFYLNPHYMMSSDYVDALECGIPPDEGSQYLVSPFVQRIFDSTIKPIRPDIFQVIKSDTSMRIQ